MKEWALYGRVIHGPPANETEFERQVRRTAQNISGEGTFWNRGGGNLVKGGLLILSGVGGIAAGAGALLTSATPLGAIIGIVLTIAVVGAIATGLGSAVLGGIQLGMDLSPEEHERINRVMSFVRDAAGGPAGRISAAVGAAAGDPEAAARTGAFVDDLISLGSVFHTAAQSGRMTGQLTDYLEATGDTADTVEISIGWGEDIESLRQRPTP